MSKVGLSLLGAFLQPLVLSVLNAPFNTYRVKVYATQHCTNPALMTV